MLSRLSKLRCLLLIIPLVVIKNYYSFYKYSQYNNSENDKLIVDEFIDTPMFEEIVGYNGEGASSLSFTEDGSGKSAEFKSDFKYFDGSRPSCTSPEKEKWPFTSCSNNLEDNEKMTRSRASNASCNLCSHTTDPFLMFLNKLAKKMEDVKRKECDRLVLYTVAFGDKYTSAFRPIYPKLVEQYHRFHNKCFFTFVLSSNNITRGEELDSEVQILESGDGLDLFVSIPQGVMPYENNRRNTKIFKMLGHLIFPWAKYLIWQDAKFRMSQKYPYYWPVNYFKYIGETMDKVNTCAVYLGLPIHESSLGTFHANFRKEAFRRHCKVLTTSTRSNVSDSQKWIQQQCDYYEQHFNNTNNTGYSTNIERLSSGMVDSGLMVRDMRSEKCRTFNAELACTWFDEIHCFADRDQVSFPFALISMGVREHDVSLDPVNNHRIFVDAKNNINDPMVLILKSHCHYYFTATVRRCYPVDANLLLIPPRAVEEKPLLLPSKKSGSKRVAIIVSGSLRRYFFQSSLEHLIKPLSKQGHSVEYFLALVTGDAPAYRSNMEYMNHLNYDPVFNSGIRNIDGVFYINFIQIDSFIRNKMKEFGGKLRQIIVRKKFKIDRNELLANQRNISRTILYPTDKDPDVAFPLKDLRSPEIKKRTGNANRNILSLHLGIQELWEHLIVTEVDKDRQFDYVLFLRDDAQWLADFDLNSLIGLGHADIYVLSCDDRQPPLHIDEINDHALVVSRKVATFFGEYFTNLFKDKDMVEKCAAALKDPLDNENIRGCNSEMILKWMINQNNFTVLGVGQSYIPFQRSVHVDIGKNKDKNEISCFHKYCQSQENKLDDKGVPRCQELEF